MPCRFLSQLVHHLLQDVLTNLEQHYRANFPKWVRKYCRAKLEVNDDEVPLGGLAGMALGQPQAGNEGGAETDEEDEEDQVGIGVCSASL